MFFEGAEKKVELVVSGQNLRELSQTFWKEVVALSEASILSSISNKECDAYLLSESSLFVWSDRVLMLTCGQTTLIKSIHLMIEEFGLENIDSLIFQRKNELRSFEQHSNFLEDIKSLNEKLDGAALRFGKVHGHHHHMYFLKKEYRPSESDHTTEFLMYDIPRETISFLTNPENNKRDIIRNYLKLEEVLPGFEIDDFCFDPYGYSLNAIKGGDYYTIHMTPQETSPYISFETSLGHGENVERVINHFLKVLNPDSFDLLSFNTKVELEAFDNYSVKQDVKGKIECGYEVQFNYLFSKNTKTEAPVIVEV